MRPSSPRELLIPASRQALNKAAGDSRASAYELSMTMNGHGVPVDARGAEEEADDEDDDDDGGCGASRVEDPPPAEYLLAVLQDHSPELPALQPQGAGEMFKMRKAAGKSDRDAHLMRLLQARCPLASRLPCEDTDPGTETDLPRTPHGPPAAAAGDWHGGRCASGAHPPGVVSPKTGV